VGRSLAQAPFFRAVAVPAATRDGAVTIASEAATALGANDGDEVSVLVLRGGD
jgi:arginine/ornithine N-succinyltransferase beta subunit